MTDLTAQDTRTSATAERSALDLTVTRLIRAPRSAVWDAWTSPESLASWWVPAPARCAVVSFDPRPGGAFRTEISDDDRQGDLVPHFDGCFLAVDHGERLVFTNALVADWRPAVDPFMTAVITMRDHPLGTDYSAVVMHRDAADRSRHEELGFHEGWGTVTAQLADFSEQTAGGGS